MDRADSEQHKGAKEVVLRVLLVRFRRRENPAVDVFYLSTEQEWIEDVDATETIIVSTRPLIEELIILFVKYHPRVGSRR
jgi:hypothetical protein